MRETITALSIKLPPFVNLDMIWERPMNVDGWLDLNVSVSNEIDKQRLPEVANIVTARN